MVLRPRPAAWRAWVLWLIVALTCAVGSPATARADGEAGQQECLSAGGVWVIVDTAEQLVATGCAHHPSSGTQALQQIGVVVEQRADGKGLICELQGLPHNACAKNNGFDKATGSYWSYWHKPSAQSAWALSDQGAYTYVPPDGSIEGWRWGPGAPPRSAETLSAPVPVTKNTAVLSGPGPTLAVLGVLLAGAIAFILWRRRRTPHPATADFEDED